MIIKEKFIKKRRLGQKKMKIFSLMIPGGVIILLAGILLSQFLSSGEILVAGSWELKIEGLPTPMLWSLEINQQGESLFIQAKTESGEEHQGYGQIKGSSIYFNLSIKLFRPSLFEFKGKASWSAMSGTVILGPLFKGSWQASRKITHGALGHNSGQDCFLCHFNFDLAGTVFRDASASEPMPDVPLELLSPEGHQIILERSNQAGNFFAFNLPEGKFLMKVGDSESRSWHFLPAQKSCNRCHFKGGNGTPERDRLLPPMHTQLPTDNDCRNCHHFPASQSYEKLRTEGVLIAIKDKPQEPGSRVEIKGKIYPFDPTGLNIITVRPDIFAPGYFSMFDAILAVAKQNGLKIDYHFDPEYQTHFIDRINGLAGNYWYHFSYDAGEGNANEIKYRRANRWDEALWKPGVWISVVEGENLEEIKAEYREEIQREKTSGHLIPLVRIDLNPSSYKGNPPESHRITVSREFRNVLVTAHDLRAITTPSPYPQPFQPGVTTSLDILLSLKDQKQLDVVTSVFYTYFAQKYIFSYYVVALGFPDVGLAHASGRQGFIYLTENGSPNRLPNQADSKLHMTCDIHVIHAPDFSYWRWAELGNPYYETSEPGDAVKLARSLEEDDRALSRGFNLHEPRVNNDRTIDLSFNLFLPSKVKITLYDSQGHRQKIIVNKKIFNLGIQKLHFSAKALPSGLYCLVLEANGHRQIRHLFL